MYAVDRRKLVTTIEGLRAAGACPAAGVPGMIMQAHYL